MLPPTLKYFCSLLLVFMTGAAVSQNNPVNPVEPEGPDTVVTETIRPPKEKHDFTPTGLRLGTDLISIGTSIFGSKFSGWEANADIDFYRYYFAVDYGNWAKTLDVDNGQYENSGTYFRVGADVNFLQKDPDHNMFFIGYRYGQSFFDDHISYAYTDPIYGDMSPSVGNTGLRAHWMELTTGLRVKIWKYLWMGYTARFKFAPRVGSFTEFQPYDIPGYGLYERKTYWGFNYQIFFRIPFKKTVSPSTP